MLAPAQIRLSLEVAAPESAGCGPESSEAIKPESTVPQRPLRILILDDDQGFLDTYGKLLAALPSRPEVRIATCATRALALLDGGNFALLITDLRMPKIDGFQVLLAARRRFPALRTVAITGAGDQQYRARAYASGIDLYTEKPTSPMEVRLFAECVEALLSRGGEAGGFRGIQSKSLMDLIQIECLSHAGGILRITHGSLEGRIWIAGGNVIDAETQNLNGEEAFKEIFAWKTGHFELLPGDSGRPRSIYTSYESLLLDSAQALDESAAAIPGQAELEPGEMSKALEPLAKVHGVEALLLVSGTGQCEAWGIESREEFAAWTHRVLTAFQELGEKLNTGSLRSVEAAGPVCGVVLLSQNGRELMAGLDHRMTPRRIRAAGKELATHLGKQ